MVWLPFPGMSFIQRAHIATGHGGRMLKHLSTKNANITREGVDLLKSYLCLARSHKLRQFMTCLSLSQSFCKIPGLFSHFVKCLMN